MADQEQPRQAPKPEAPKTAPKSEAPKTLPRKPQMPGVVKFTKGHDPVKGK